LQLKYYVLYRYITIPLDQKVITNKKTRKHFKVQPFDKRVYDFLLNTDVHIIINNVVLYSIRKIDITIETAQENS